MANEDSNNMWCVLAEEDEKNEHKDRIGRFVGEHILDDSDWPYDSLDGLHHASRARNPKSPDPRIYEMKYVCENGTLVTAIICVETCGFDATVLIKQNPDGDYLIKVDMA